MTEAQEADHTFMCRVQGAHGNGYPWMLGPDFREATTVMPGMGRSGVGGRLESLQPHQQTMHTDDKAPALAQQGEWTAAVQRDRTAGSVSRAEQLKTGNSEVVPAYPLLSIALHLGV